MNSLLVIEDDHPLRSALEHGLGDRGHVVHSIDTGMGGLQHVLARRPDIVLLDLGLPDVDGLTLIGMIRATSQVPIIVITATDDDPTMIRSLDAGADDYVVKPFTLDHVSARIRALVRRTRHVAKEPIHVGDLVIDEPSRTATLAGEPLSLARREFDLLFALAQRPGIVVSKRDLLADVWEQPEASERTIDVHLSWLRRKLGETAAHPRYLHSVRGVGVRLVHPPRVEAGA